MIYIARWQTAHRPVHLLFQVTPAFTPALELYFKHVTFIEGHRFYKSEFSPPVGCGRMLENMIVNIGNKLAIVELVQFAYSHAITRES